MTEITLQQVSYDLNTLYQRRLALEGFQGLMEGRDVVTGPTADAMRIALEDADSDEEGVTGKDLATGVKKVAITVKNIIKWLLRTIGKLVEKLGLGMQKLGAKNTAVKQALKSLSEADRSSVSADKPVEASALNPAMLCVDGQFVGNDPEQVNNAVKMGDYIHQTFPKMFDSILGKVEQLAKTHASDETSEAFFKAFASLLQSSLVKPDVQFGSTDVTGDAHDGAIATVPLLGNRGFVMMKPEAASELNSDRPIEALRQVFTFSFPEYNVDKNVPDEIPGADIATVTTLSTLVDKSVGGIQTGESDMKSLISGRVQSIERVVEELSNKGPGASGEILEAIGLVLQRFAAVMTEVESWYMRTMLQELNYLESCVNATPAE